MQGHRGKHQEVRRQKTEMSRGLKTQPLLELPGKGKMGQNRLGLASLNNSLGFWAIGLASLVV